MGIVRTQDVTVADAWPNDDGGVSLEIEGRIVPVTPEEAIAFAVTLYAAAVDAAEAADDKVDAEQALAQFVLRGADGRLIRRYGWDVEP